ncbi:GCD14 protein [Plectosphaerella plurivora]|uniref:tRNA (adenine(58)-N(1))-methyltransferase catalytic subunit TRM61 n=1 Tax=Plectosphaerella plurivora TaxID=936078 RepID=A0A9P9AEA7_9PEZI|nr:GCD14 protein [Plectosphaerella plurivora]
MTGTSAFLEHGSKTTAGALAIIQLSRDSLMPVLLQDHTGDNDGYAEGAVLNTRFGSFPHSTFIGVPWGSQIRASAVDTGSRGRKRKRPEDNDSATPGVDDSESANPVKKAITASSGFVHILPPTPELWTQSLPHRTQVVYTPDYSYVLQRLRARPGVHLIEAGAGSGSFTHASVRAVYDGYPATPDQRRGKVFSFEFNHMRYEKMQEEITRHRLEGIVQLTHRDAYTGGFLVDDNKSPEATAIFLDLPAPWDALPHLSRTKPTGPDFDEKFKHVTEWTSPLDPKKNAYLCTFSPCIEQVQRTITTMRRLGWVEIDTIEIAHRRIVVNRERPAGMVPVEKKAPPEPSNVAEAVSRLREIERRSRVHNAKQFGQPLAEEDLVPAPDAVDIEKGDGGKPWRFGRVTHRTEGDMKSHTSYLVFATLPRGWSEEEEAAALAKWPCGNETTVVGSVDKATRKQEKRDMLAAKKNKRQKGGKKAAAGGTDTPMTETEASSTA